MTSLLPYLIETAEITEQENGIYSCPIAHYTIGMQANAYLFGHPVWGEEYFKRTHRSETFRARWQKACGSWDHKIVVDIGCGPGNVYATVGGSPYLLIGVDIAQGALENAQQIGYVPLLADAHHLPFINGFADLVIINATIHHCDDMVQVLAEAARLVRAEGLLVTDMDPQASAWNFRGLGQLGRKVQWHPAYRLIADRLHRTADEARARMATELHNKQSGDGLTPELYHQVLEPLGFTVQLFPHNHYTGAEVLEGDWGRSPQRVRVCQRLSGIDPNTKEAAQSIMCIAKRSVVTPPVASA
jgi:SAM-dependent methyltransferase